MYNKRNIMNDQLSILALLALAIILQNGSHVQGQIFLPSGTTLRCYGTDSTCSSTPTVNVYDYGPDDYFEANADTINSCCFTSLSLSAYRSNYYYVTTGSKCQSCSDSNVKHGDEDFTGYCYNDDLCQSYDWDSATFFYGLNSCCGNSAVFYDYYSLTYRGECLSCFPPDDSPSGGADPHFVCPLRNHENLCFSVQGIPDFMFNLFTDTNLLVNAKFAFPKPEESRFLIATSTFIEQMGITVKSPVTSMLTKVKISALDHSIKIEENLITVEDHPITVIILDNNITTRVGAVGINPVHDETAWVRIATNVGFGLKFKFVKKHLDYIITNTTGLTAIAHGIQGQFMGSDVIIDEDNGLMKIGSNRAPFSVKKGKIWPYLRINGTCWYPTDTDDQGAGVLEGVYTDYIVDDLFAYNFIYNKFK